MAVDSWAEQQSTSFKPPEIESTPPEIRDTCSIH
jgi:hypothetical protein